jgi:hypothetical protein
MMAKGNVPIALVEELDSPQILEKWQGTDADKHDMFAIGRRQQLRVCPCIHAQHNAASANVLVRTNQSLEKLPVYLNTGF